ncbi:MAG: pilus assembly protein PilM [Akkermansia sp.]
MSDSRQVVALNIGSQRVTMGVFTKTVKNGLTLNRYAHKIVDLDPAEESARLGLVSNAIAELISELKVKGSTVNYSIFGQSVFIRFVKLPPIENADVDQLIGFEAQQHVPFPLNEVVWDYHLLPASGGEQEAILVAIKSDLLNSINEGVISHGVLAGNVDCVLTSLYNAYRDSYPTETDPVVIIDIGAKSTDLIYSENGRFFTRSVSAGGIFVTSTIARDFGTSFLEAEQAKISKGMVSMTNGQTEGMDPNIAALATSIRNAMTRLSSEVQRITNHYRAQMHGSAPVKAYLCGGGALLPYTKEFLEERLGIPVQFFNPMHNVGVGSHVDMEAVGREAFMLGGVVGTALGAVGRATLKIDLVPASVATMRAAKKKYPKVLAASIIAVVGAAVYASSSFIALNYAEQAQMKIEQKSGAADAMATSIDGDKRKIAKLDDQLNDYAKLVLERYGYSDVLTRFIGKAKSNAYWVVDFDPIMNFNPDEQSGITGTSVIKDSFLSEKNSSLAEPPAEAAEQTPKRGRAKAQEKQSGLFVNAIRLKGFVRLDSGGYDAVQEMQKRLAAMAEDSPLFTFSRQDGTPLEARQYLVLGETKQALVTNKNAAPAFAQSFTIVLPLKTPLPVEKGVTNKSGQDNR